MKFSSLFPYSLCRKNLSARSNFLLTRIEVSILQQYSKDILQCHLHNSGVVRCNNSPEIRGCERRIGIGEGWMIRRVESLDAESDVLRLLSKFESKIAKESKVDAVTPGPLK